MRTRESNLEPVQCRLGEFVNRRETAAACPYNALDLVWEPVAFSDEYRALEGDCRLEDIGDNQERFAVGSCKNCLPLRWDLCHSRHVLLEVLGGLL